MNKEHKKQLIWASGVLLALGASLTLGLLSFGGLYAMYPCISMGLGSFALASLYEGEIYFQNIKQAFKKIFTPNFYDHEHSDELITKIIDKYKQTASELPQFFKDYQIAADKAQALSNNEPGSAKEEKALKNLDLMRRYFLKVATYSLKQDQPYAKELKDYIEKMEQKFQLPKLIKEAKNKQYLIKLGLYFSLITSALFSLGSVYLILDTLATLTFITLPLPIIIGMSLVCGVSYGFLTYNSISDMIWNKTLQNWYHDVKMAVIDTSNPGKAIALTLGSILLIGLATCLTLFTAGTWWTIAKDIKNLPPLLKKVPAYFTQIIIPSITATATLIFTLENTKNSLDLVIEMFSYLPKKINQLRKSTSESIQSFFTNLHQGKIPRHQLLNPFNFFIYILETPLRIIGFVLHIASVGVTTNRIPGVPMSISSGLSMGSEGFEDFHYFVGHECDGHDHNNDIPTKIIKFIINYSGLKNLSYAWHSKGRNWFSEPTDFYNQFKPHQKKSIETKEPPSLSPTASSYAQCCIHLSSVNKDMNTPGENATSTQWEQQKILMTLDDEIDATSPLKNKTQKDTFIQLKAAILKEPKPRVRHAYGFIGDTTDYRHQKSMLESLKQAKINMTSDDVTLITEENKHSQKVIEDLIDGYNPIEFYCQPCSPAA